MRVIVVVAVLVALAGPSAPASGVQPRPVVRAGVVESLEVLHTWDERRAAAWAAKDQRALRSLYVRGSGAARSDVSLLRAYTARHLVVRRMVTQVFGVTVLRQETDRLVIRVRDRFAGGVVDDGGRDVALPSTPPVVRRLDFRRDRGTWRIASVLPS